MPSTLKAAEYRELLEKAFDRYEEIIKGCESELKEDEALPYVALHYWNPMDYRSRIKFPSYFSEETKKAKANSDPFWLLHRKFLHCDFGEKNFKHTWNQGEDFKEDSMFLRYQNPPIYYSK